MVGTVCLASDFRLAVLTFPHSFADSENPTQLRRPQPPITPIRVVSTSLTAAIPVMTSIQLRLIPRVRRMCLITCRAHLKRETMACTTVCAGTATALQTAPKRSNPSKPIVVGSFLAMVCALLRSCHCTSLPTIPSHSSDGFHLLLRILLVANTNPTEGEDSPVFVEAARRTIRIPLSLLCNQGQPKLREYAWCSERNTQQCSTKMDVVLL